MPTITALPPSIAPPSAITGHSQYPLFMAIPALKLAFNFLVGFDDALHQRVTDYISFA